MIKHNYFVKLIKKINLTINKLIENNLNKFNSINLYKISKSNKFFLSLTAIFVLFLSYLLIPNIYDKVEISKKLNDKLQKRFNLNFNLSQNLKYNFFPRPHFIYKNTSILKNDNEISKVEELKIFISLDNLFSYKNFEIKDLIIEKSNFNLNNQTYDFFTKLLDADFKKDKLIIKNSNIFYKNKDDEVLFINKILHMEYFYDIKNLRNKLVSKNQIFNLLYSIKLDKDNIEKKILSKLNLDFLKLKIDNELDLSNEVKKGLINFTKNKDKFSAIYNFDKDYFIFELFDNIENSKFFYKGKVNLNPFHSKLEATFKEIDISYLSNSNMLILQLLKTEILNNKNFDLDLSIYAKESKNFKDFINIYLNSKIQEGLIDIDDTRFSWRDAADLSFKDSLIYVKDNELILDGKLDLTIKNSDEIYQSLLTPKKYRNEIRSIKVSFVYNFDQRVVNLKNIIIDSNNNKDVNKILQSLMLKKNKIQNKVYLKSMLNKALKFYAG